MNLQHVELEAVRVDVEWEFENDDLEIVENLGSIISKKVGETNDLSALSISASAEMGLNLLPDSSACFALLFRGLVGGLP